MTTPSSVPAGRWARISGWGSYAPSAVLTNADLERMVDTNDEWIVSRTGIRERRVAAAHETTASMGAVAGARAIAVAGLEPDDVDLILVATLTPDYWMPSTAALVKEAIGNTRAFAMDVSAACSGFVYAYATARAYVTSGLARHVLVIGAELLTRFLDYTDRSTCILFGDGAGAVVVSASDEPTGPHGMELTTEPQGAYMIWLPAGGSKSPSSAETVSRGEHFIRMEGKETYRFATKTLASSALAAIEDAGLHPDDIDLVIPHQANIRIIEAVAKGLDFPMDRIFVNLDRYGNTSAASVPLALAEAVDSGRVKVGDKIVFVAFGAGFTSGAVAMEWTADPANAARAAAIDPEAIRVRLPVDWDSVDPIPSQLAAVLAAPGPVDVPLDDVVPGDPGRPATIGTPGDPGRPATTVRPDSLRARPVGHEVGIDVLVHRRAVGHRHIDREMPDVLVAVAVTPGEQGEHPRLGRVRADPFPLPRHREVEVGRGVRGHDHPDRNAPDVPPNLRVAARRSRVHQTGVSKYVVPDPIRLFLGALRLQRRHVAAGRQQVRTGEPAEVAIGVRRSAGLMGMVAGDKPDDLAPLVVPGDTALLVAAAKRIHRRRPGRESVEDIFVAGSGRHAALVEEGAKKLAAKGAPGGQGLERGGGVVLAEAEILGQAAVGDA